MALTAAGPGITFTYNSGSDTLTISALADLKDSVRVATAAALPTNTRTGNLLTASANGALPAIDGVSLSVGNRLLVKNEVTGANNGIYTVTALGDGSNPWVLTRGTDADSDAEMTTGVLAFVAEGTTYADTLWALSTNDPITLNTTALTFAQLTGAGSGGSYSDEQAQDAVGTILLDGIGINFTYNDATPSITAEPIFAGSGSAGTVARSDHGHSGVVTGFSVELGNGTDVITSTEPLVIVRMPVAFTWTAWYIQADVSGSITIEVERATEAAPTTFSSIAGTAKPTLSAAQSNSDTSLTNWGDTTTDAGDRIRISVSGTPASVKRVAVHFAMTRSL